MSFYKKLVGEKVYLSPLSNTADAARKLTKWFSDPLVSDTMGMSAALLTEKDHGKWITDEFGVSAEDKYFAIVLTSTDELLGYCELRNIAVSHRSATVAIMIGDAENRGKGYGTDALKLLLKYGFCSLGLHSVNLTVFDGNDGAARAYEKAGFKVCGRQRESVFVGGRFIDRIYMDILDREYFGI